MIGDYEGEVCGRRGCTGVIRFRESDAQCSCHINPPCSACTDKVLECPECEITSEDDDWFEEAV